MQALCHSPSRPVLYSSSGGAVHCLHSKWSAEANKPLFTVEVSGTVKALFYENSNDFLIIGTDEEIVVMNGKSGVALSTTSLAKEGGIEAIYYSSKSKLVFTASKEKVAKRQGRGGDAPQGLAAVDETAAVQGDDLGLSGVHDLAPPRRQEKQSGLSIIRMYTFSFGGQLKLVGNPYTWAERCSHKGEAFTYSLTYDWKHRLLFSGRNDGTLRTWHVGEDKPDEDKLSYADEKPATLYDNHRISILAYDKSLKWLFTAAPPDGPLAVWQCGDIDGLAGGKHGKSSEAYKLTKVDAITADFKISALVFDKHLRMLFVGGSTGEVAVWKINLLGKAQRTFSENWQTDHSAVQCLSFDWRRGLLVIGGRKSKMGVFRVQETTGQLEDRLTEEWEVSKTKVNCMVYDPTQRLLFRGEADGSVCVMRSSFLGYTVETFKEPADHEYGISCMDIDPDRRILFAAERMGPIRVWHYKKTGRGCCCRTGSLESMLDMQELEFSVAESMLFTTAERVLVTGHKDGSINQWRLDDVEEGFALQRVGKKMVPHSEEVLCMTYMASNLRGVPNMVITGGRDSQLCVLKSEMDGTFTLLNTETNAQGQRAKDRICCMDCDSMWRYVFTGGCNNKVSVWQLTEDGKFKLSFHLQLDDGKSNANNRVGCLRFLPEQRLLIVSCMGNTTPMLLKVTEYGHLIEAWFPQYLYRGTTNAIASSRDSGNIWLCSERGSILCIAADALVKSKVSIMDTDVLWLASIYSWWGPPLVYVGKIFAVLGQVAQQLSLAFSVAVPVVLAPPQRFLQGIAELAEVLRFLHLTQDGEFRLAVGVVAVWAALFLIQERVEDLILLKPEDMLPFIVFLVMSLVFMALSAVGTVPLTSSLMSGLVCGESCNGTAIPGDPGRPRPTRFPPQEVNCPECGSLEHIAESVIGFSCVLVMLYLAVRFTRARWTLEAITFKRNPFDWSADSLLPPDRVPRRYPLELNDLTQDVRTIVGGMWIITTRYILTLTGWEQATENLITAVITAAFGAWWVKTAWQHNRFFDPGPKGILPMAFGIEPNALQFALTMGIFYGYTIQLTSAIAIFYFGQENLERKFIWVFLACFIIVPMLLSYAVFCKNLETLRHRFRLKFLTPWWRDGRKSATESTGMHFVATEQSVAARHVSLTNRGTARSSEFLGPREFLDEQAGRQQALLISPQGPSGTSSLSLPVPSGIRGGSDVELGRFPSSSGIDRANRGGSLTHLQDKHRAGLRGSNHLSLGVPLDEEGGLAMDAVPTLVLHSNSMNPSPSLRI